MTKRYSENGIYSLEVSEVWGAKVQDLRSAEFFVETESGARENTRRFLGRGEECIPIGPHRPPFEEIRLNKYGEGSGFAPETPRLHIEFQVRNFKDDRPLRELLWGGSPVRMGSWIVTSRFRSVLETLDPEGWDFWPISTSLHTKTETRAGPDVWLADLVRGLRAVDDPKTIHLTPLMQRKALRFRSKDIGTAPFFRDPLVSWEMLCTEAARVRLNSEGISGLSFWEIGGQYD